MKYRDLFIKAQEMLEYSYAPFSKFRVGAALLAKSGEIYTGCNVENSSLGGTICAERTAMVKAVSEGCRDWEAVAIASSGGEAWPCGICRQFMREFVDDDFVIITGDDVDHLRTYTMTEILPEGFKL